VALASSLETIPHQYKFGKHPDFGYTLRLTEAILDRAEAFVASAIPMGCIDKPGELAPTVLFLASEVASYITGQVIAIDGGRTAQ
jgi:NAD(P)-dependent dehydrogenase (short-subunit alcohol dehydrogenase family)